MPGGRAGPQQSQYSRGHASVGLGWMGHVPDSLDEPDETDPVSPTAARNRLATRARGEDDDSLKGIWPPDASKGPRQSIPNHLGRSLVAFSMKTIVAFSKIVIFICFYPIRQVFSTKRNCSIS